jgi:hypothetical protein
VAIASFTALLITAAVARLLRPQAADLTPHQPQSGVLQPPYQPHIDLRWAGQIL